jgi:hypothetical protein
MKHRPKNREIYLCAIAKDEGPYIQEWIDYHFKLGFEKAVVYANDWTYRNDDSRIQVINVKGGNRQQSCYNNFLKYYRDKFWWTAFFDIDEFLVLHKHKNIEELLLEYDHRKALAIHWARYGSNGHTKVIDGDYNVLKRFTRRGTEKDHETNLPYLHSKHKDVIIKTIYRFNNQSSMGVHNCTGTAYTLNDKPLLNMAYDTKIDWSIAQINHYWIKSIEEAKLKMERGRPTGKPKRNWEQHFLRIDKYSNTVEDLCAVEFYHGKKIADQLREKENK